MNTEERQKASKEQVLRYLYSYYPNWRYAKILAIKKILENKEDFFRDTIPLIKQSDDPTGESTIYQEITNGLVWSALSECLQYIEDLFLFIKFSRNPTFFIKNVVTYKAGKITNYIKSFDSGLKQIQTVFLIPEIDEKLWHNNEKKKSDYERGINYLKQQIDQIIDFFKENEFFYNQYKHGLTIALRPYSLLTNKAIKRKKAIPTTGFLVACDNLSIEKVINDTDRFQQMLVLPCFTDNTKPFLNDLLKEDNLLRFVQHPKGEVSLEYILTCALKVRLAINTLISNLISSLQENNDGICLPHDDHLLVFKFHNGTENKK